MGGRVCERVGSCRALAPSGLRDDAIPPSASVPRPALVRGVRAGLQEGRGLACEGRGTTDPRLVIKVQRDDQSFEEGRARGPRALEGRERVFAPGPAPHTRRGPRGAARCPRPAGHPGAGAPHARRQGPGSRAGTRGPAGGRGEPARWGQPTPGRGRGGRAHPAPSTAAARKEALAR